MNTIIYTAGHSPALPFAKKALEDRGIQIAQQPNADVTHLLLPVPSFEADGTIRGGGTLENVLAQLPANITVVGGNLDHSTLSDYQTLDLLADPYYLSENASITADCAIQLAGNHLGCIWKDCPILIVGWGRIGKFLSHKLHSIGADVTVAARKDTDRAMIHSFGMHAQAPAHLDNGLIRYRVIFNTVPAPMISETQASSCRPDCVLVDLASKKGIAAQNVLWARGLPGKDAPESAGQLMAKAMIRLILGGGLTT